MTPPKPDTPDEIYVWDDRGLLRLRLAGELGGKKYVRADRTVSETGEAYGALKRLECLAIGACPSDQKRYDAVNRDIETIRQSLRGWLPPEGYALVSKGDIDVLLRVHLKDADSFERWGIINGASCHHSYVPQDVYTDAWSRLREVIFPAAPTKPEPKDE